MINTYNTTTQNVVANGTITFTTDRILTGCTVTRNGNTFQLNKPGYYYVTFNAVAAATETVGDLTVELYNNGVAVPGAIATVTTTTAGNNDNYAFTTIIRVLPSCPMVNNAANLTIVNTGVDATYTVANINITKLC